MYSLVQYVLVILKLTISNCHSLIKLFIDLYWLNSFLYFWVSAQVVPNPQVLICGCLL